jgi:Cys-tRNA(Pro) deacylase
MLSKSAQKVKGILKSMGFNNQIVEISGSTRTSKEAADAVGCQVGQIAKSLVFQIKKSNQPIVIVTSGANRVDEEIMADVIGEEIEMADADFVRKVTGFVIGGVPPVGYKQKVRAFIDEDLLEYEEIWAAAGTPNSVFMLTPEELVKLTGGEVVSVR